ncbi:DegT/DnrJ/EryC1/StrS family aminotransferase [Maridesulfovibrio salexigens]|uniref:DegT/DnrJ/EryC1/StrS aminotransferase n=1 Tax=Maridesulfovibrio salexigens (strain ATCC 14822 / DSM 2638 / NCIMB 8403 / VKM B-1763) TaxID=526222 RepID=C6BTJ0_MARSD|nr:DegT/DnrJ/EryC1/StrS family aminotransferase [Maridesulfovibrio salexigens]ACS81671.1 DegT/DnrJ/EryC1/StrS aminotransferase [Maridesulfovibrio salexigens DSM 2638]
MNIPFIDLKKQFSRVEKQVRENMDTVLDHGAYIMGPEIPAIEEKLAEYCGTKHALGCASGTDALTLALMSLDVKPGDAVFTTPFTFFATAETIALTGATPVFVDIDPVTFNIDPKKLDKTIEALKGADNGCVLPKVDGLTAKGIISVDIFGLPADYEAIKAVADKHDLFLIEDAAQSFGGEYKGKRACSLGDITCTSFFPAKPLGCYGDGGMCFTDDDYLIERLRSHRIHGMGPDRYDNVRLGITGRLDSLQAAILLAKFEIFPEEVDLRDNVAATYAKLLADVEGLTVPTVPEGYRSVWAQYCPLAKDGEHRERIQKALGEKNIPSPIYYPIPMHLQTAFKDLGYKMGDCPISEDAASRIFAIPMHPYLEREQQEFIADIIRNA